MRVLMVYSNSIADLLPAPPIGLSYVASAAARAGHQVEFLDLLMNEQSTKALGNMLERFRPQVVGLSVRNMDNLVHQHLKTHLDSLAHQLSIIRQHSDADIVLGGPAISILAGGALKRLDADFVIKGEGEESFPLLLKELAGERNFRDVPGLCYRQNDKIRCNPPRAMAHFGSSGMGRWLKWERYQQRGATWPIQTKRGCPLHCSYCTYSAVEGRNIRKRSPQEVVDEIEQVAATIKPRTFEFIDSTFNLPQSHAIAICEEIIRRGLKINLTAMGINPLGVSKELFALMKRAGFNSMMITPEHASDPVLKGLDKGFTAEQVRHTAELARNSGIPSMWFFMMGGPNETKETVEETVSFVENELTWKGCISMFTTGIRVLPETALARRAIEDGCVTADQDLSEPVFYFSPHVSEGWILRRINQTITNHPNVVHAAEDSHPRSKAITERVHRLYDMLGIAPPYWRFLPRLLSLAPIHRLRLKSYGGRRRRAA